MTECQVYQVILFRKSVVIFVEYERGGGGSMCSFVGTGEEPRCVVEDVDASPFKHPQYAGCKLLGTMKKDNVQEAWAACREYIANEENKHEEVTDWCVAAAALLETRGLVVAGQWWALPE
ncbi:hypothetical protein V2A60_009813 [Cordyceps javanica]|uniref:Uncharacterized protein n=1 Tax=Cordyceps javanica TaxID=43265 RepID=A0A545V072_9HYPO|nr:hypothetical protein IF1G_06107 [Cordyceps javanica]TQW05676.1 hypothetical protein IF2G_06798 [Cordyceps javanica]